MFVGAPQPRETELSIQWSRDDVPRDVAEDLDVNPHLFPLYVEQVKKAMLESLTDSATKPRIMSASLLKERIREIHQAILVLRQEKGLSLRRILDVLPGHYMTALKRGQKTVDVAEQHELEATAWSRQRVLEVPADQARQDPRLVGQQHAKLPRDESALAKGMEDPIEVNRQELPDEWQGEIIPAETDKGPT